MNPYTAAATLAIRILALAVFTVSAWQLCANLALTWRDFDPNYLGYFLESQAIRPGIGIILALVLYFCSSFFGRRLSHRLDSAK